MRAPPDLLVSIDPGLPDCGVAIYERGQFVRAAWCKVAPSAGNCPLCLVTCDHASKPAMIDELCDAVEGVLSTHLGESPLRPSVALTEWPQIFHNRGKLQGTTVQQLLDLAGVAAVLQDRFISWGAKPYRFTPQQWKGNKPKDQHQRMGLCLLSPEERAHLPRTPRSNRYLSDPLDAALLGQWWLAQQQMREPRAWGQPSDFIDLVEAA